MGPDHQRRIIGYFTGWRTGKDGTPAYLVNDVHWDKVTHLNYAFGHVDSGNRLSVGADGATNAATGTTFPGVPGAEMDPSLPYQGHFNLLTKYKKQHPNVKTLISVGGWAETGGYFRGDGKRVDSGGFYSTTVNADGSVNQAGINTFADSSVDFIKKYGFNGVDIDYEYPTSVKDAGNPLDWPTANARRGSLVKGYAALLRTLREKLDRAGATDGKHYLLSIASPSSGYLLRGMRPSRSRSTWTTSTSCRTTCTARGTSTWVRTPRCSTTARTPSWRPPTCTGPRSTAASAISTRIGRTTTSAVRCRPGG